MTGGAGFIGSNLVRLINAESPSIEVLVLDDFSVGSIQNLEGAKADIIEGTILSQSDLKKALEGVDFVVHLAALGSVPRSIANPEDTHNVNVTGTLLLLEEMRINNVTNIFFSSSSSVYGGNSKLPKNEKDWVFPLSPYAASKLAGETYVLAYGHCYGMQSFVARFFNVYGPFQSSGHPYAAVVPRFLSAALEGDEIVIDGDGLQTRDFTYVDTVSRAILKVVQEKMRFEGPVNFAFGTETSIRQLTDVIQHVVAKPLDIKHGNPRSGDVRGSRADGVLFRELFPELLPIPLSLGVENTLENFRRTG